MVFALKAQLLQSTIGILANLPAIRNRKLSVVLQQWHENEKAATVENPLPQDLTLNVKTLENLNTCPLESPVQKPV